MPSLAPLRAVGNLRLTRGGVYADYLLSGLPFIFLSEEWQNMVAAEHAELWRSLPSGATISGLTAPVPARNIARKMLHTHPDLREGQGLGSAGAWMGHCRTWEPTLTRHRPRRRIYWLSVPLDYGLSGHTASGGWRHLVEVAVGRDKDTGSSLARYRDLAARIVAALPRAFFAKPVSVEQIWWHWNYTASRGVWQHPLPSRPYDPHASLPGSAFGPVHFDESAARLRGRRWRAARADTDVFVRTYRDRTDGIGDSYQALIPLDSFPDTGIAWPRATIFKVLDDLTHPGITLDWTINTTFTSAESAVALAQNVITNIRDQYRQRGRHADSDDELVRKLASGKELASELKRGAAERGVDVAVLVTAAGGDVDAVNRAVGVLMRSYRRQNIGARRWRGSQTNLWGAFNPGSERGAALGEFRSPTTTGRFAKFVPLLASKLGNSTGVPLGMNLTSPGLCDVVLLDLLNAPDRENPANLVICGSPGRGKSHIAKLLIGAWLSLGAGLHIFDPSQPREHQRALSGFDDKVVIDLADPGICIDPLRIFPFHTAAEHAVDHLLPLLGYAAVSRQAARLRAHLASGSRDAHGIGSMTGLIGYLRDLPDARDPTDDDLLVGLEGLRTESHLRALFDEGLPVSDLTRAAAVIWNTAGLDLPVVAEENVAHLHRLTTPRQRAGQAIYGLAADLAQTIFFARPGRPDVLVVEEAAPLTNSMGGQKCCNRIIRQGRKSWTGFLGISQHPIKDFAVLEDEFIDQRLCLAFRDAGLARATLEWCGRDLQRHPELLRNYVENTSPVSLVDHGDDIVDVRYGKVIAGREGEAWYLDEFGGFGKVGLFEAPTAALAAQLDTNPRRWTSRWPPV
jgi:AAA-like domain